MKGLDLIIVIIVVTVVIIRKIAEASRQAQQQRPPTGSPSAGQKDAEMTVGDIEELLGRRRTVARGPGGAAPPGRAPVPPGPVAASDAAGFRADPDEVSELFDRPEASEQAFPSRQQTGAQRSQPSRAPTQQPSRRPAVQGGASPTFGAPGAGLTPPPKVRTAEISDGPARPRGKRRVRPVTAETAKEQSSSVIAPFESPLRLGRKLTPMQQAILFADIFGKPGGKFRSI